jgi:hypothetical protein
MTEKTKTRFGKNEDVLNRIKRLEAFLDRHPRAGVGGTAGVPHPPVAADLEKRLAALEKRIRGHEEGNGKSRKAARAEGQPISYCALPPVKPRTFAPEVSADRARLIENVSKKWVNGTKLRYCFFDSGSAAAGDEQKNFVREGFDVWKGVGIGIKFEEVRDLASAEVRVGFVQGDGSWSYIGRDIIDVPGQVERTMNFGWDLTADPRGVDVPVHEIGHTLGFPHEHQNPFAGIVWDEQAVYKYFGGPPNNWPRATTEFNILRKLSTAEVQGTQWDPDSIMHYAFAAGLILQPEKYHDGLRPHGGLSPHDIAQVKLFYPPHDDAGNPELKLFRSQALNLAPAQQANFTLRPADTRTYTMQTFGGSDAVMVLFKDHDGDLRFVDGSDDSGTPHNARITARLTAGRKYVLRIRLYSSYDTGEIAVMVW